ncbi:MAG: alginate lyase family protein [Bacteroidota bacterium]
MRVNIVTAVKIFLVGLVVFFPVIATCQAFVHPGLLHSREDLERMKKAIAEKQEPIYSGYKLFIQNPASQNTYKMQGPMAMVGRNPTVGQGTYDNDANAAHQNAVMWAITGEKNYADKAIEIINAWSATLKSITGRDAVLMAGLGPFKMVNAAEIIRYTNAGWSEADIQKTEKHFKDVIYPVLKDFAPFANGNWDAAAIKTVLAIAVFCNDRPMFESALRYYVDGSGNGRLTNYVINEAGQIQETGRDQGHTQLGIGLLAECSEIAWHQGLDLYGYANNRLLKGFEYTAKYNLNNDVPFVPVLDRTGKYEHFVPSAIGRGRLRAVYEQIYYHYVNRMGLEAPFTKQAAEKIRPEGPGQPGADHPGYGTLFYSRPPQPAFKWVLNIVPAAPGGLVAKGSSTQITLTWIASVGADNYTVKRSSKPGGPYTVIAKKITTANYTDTQIKAGVVYYYTVSASDDKGESAGAFGTGIAAGLPSPWQQEDIGAVTVPGSSFFDGSQFRLEGSGFGVDSLRDSFRFTWLPLNGDGTVTARLLPEPGSQLSAMGLMMREANTDDAAFASILIYPGRTKQIEAPAWEVKLLTRIRSGDKTSEMATVNLSAPSVTYGRLTGAYWIRLQRKGNVFSASGSYDGKEWTRIGNAVVSLKKTLLLGIPVCSGMVNSTIVRFDNVSVIQMKVTK